MDIFERQERMKARLEREAKYGTRFGRPRNEEKEAVDEAAWPDPPEPENGETLDSNGFVNGCVCPGCAGRVKITENRIENHKGRYGFCKWSGRKYESDTE